MKYNIFYYITKNWVKYYCAKSDLGMVHIQHPIEIHLLRCSTSLTPIFQFLFRTNQHTVFLRVAAVSRLLRCLRRFQQKFRYTCLKQFATERLLIILHFYIRKNVRSAALCNFDIEWYVDMY